MSLFPLFLLFALVEELDALSVCSNSVDVFGVAEQDPVLPSEVVNVRGKVLV